MNNTTRLLAIVLANLILVAVTLYKLSISGIDIENSRLIDNKEDLSFVFDFISFLVFSFAINVVLFICPSKKRNTLEEIIKIIKEKKLSPTTKHSRKQSA